MADKGSSGSARGGAGGAAGGGAGPKRLGEGSALKRDASRPTMAVEVATTRGPPRRQESQPARPNAAPRAPGQRKSAAPQQQHQQQPKPRPKQLMLPQEQAAPPRASPPAVLLAPHHGGGHQLMAGSRLEAAVLGGCMWCPACTAAAPPLPDSIPLTFSDLDQYVGTFEPLLHEEAREGTRAAFQEARNAGKGWAVSVGSFQELATGWYGLRLVASDRTAFHSLREGQVLVITQQPQPGSGGSAGTGGSGGDGKSGGGRGGRRGVHEDRPVKRTRLLEYDGDLDSSSTKPQAPKPAAASPKPSPPPSPRQAPAPVWATHVTAVVRGGRRDERRQGVVSVLIHPCCGAHNPSEPASPCLSALPALRTAAAAGVTGPGDWWVTPCDTLVTSVRECDTLARLRNLRLLRPVLRPDAELVVSLGDVACVWPAELSDEVAHGGFNAYLRRRYDGPQLRAIELSATHVARPGGAAGPGRADLGGKRCLPITLIQGPPGTGKTHTVLGILNAWHLTQFQRYYVALEGWLVAQARAVRGGALPLMDPGLGALKPRILVCAPSNAAIDELLERILKDGFAGREGAPYRPSVCRVGADEALNEGVKRVWAEEMGGRLLALLPPEWAGEVTRAEATVNAAAARVLSGQLRLTQLPDGDEAARASRDLVNAFEDHQRAAAALARLQMVAPFVHDTATRASVLSAREETERRKAARRGGGAAAAADAAAAAAAGGRLTPPPPGRLTPSEAFAAAPARLRDDLEVMYTDEAEMVFTTLSSSARGVFGKLQRGFPLVLIDEAAQAAEVAALQPLVYGASDVVMVGDPQQLPATIFSAGAREVEMERSLFQRLSLAGCPVSLLSVQYRMHPEIRTFPSAYFYNGRLVDAPSIVARPPALFYTAPCGLLQPYRVFDVACGSERFVSKSAQNEAEARLAIALVWELAKTLRQQQRQQQQQDHQQQQEQQGVNQQQQGQQQQGQQQGQDGGGQLALKPPPPQQQQSEEDLDAASAAAALSGLEVAIVTPYRSQRKLLRELAARLLGPAAAAALRIETVDSFQGKQMDVVILSCTRARPGSGGSYGGRGRGGGGGGGGGVGFLADTRRMNVAITRAKLALWVLGNFRTLSADATWGALIDDARVRGAVVEDASAPRLFPAHRYPPPVAAAGGLLGAVGQVGAGAAADPRAPSPGAGWPPPQQQQQQQQQQPALVLHQLQPQPHLPPPPSHQQQQPQPQQPVVVAPAAPPPPALAAQQGPSVDDALPRDPRRRTPPISQLAPAPANPPSSAAAHTQPPVTVASATPAAPQVAPPAAAAPAAVAETVPAPPPAAAEEPSKQAKLEALMIALLGAAAPARPAAPAASTTQTAPAAPGAVVSLVQGCLAPTSGQQVVSLAPAGAPAGAAVPVPVQLPPGAAVVVLPTQGLPQFPPPRVVAVAPPPHHHQQQDQGQQLGLQPPRQFVAQQQQQQQPSPWPPSAPPRQ